LRERLLELRETHIFSLREKVSSLSSQLKLLSIIFAISAAVLGWLGIKEYRDLNRIINSYIRGKIEDSVSFNDRAYQAFMLANQDSYRAALDIYKELSEKRPEIEVVFYSALHCYAMLGEYEKGYEFLNNLRIKGVFPRKFKTLLSHNNAGYIVLAKSLKDRNSKYEIEALELLSRAKEIGTVDEDPHLILPLQNLVYLHIAKGEKEKASEYAQRLKKLANFRASWWKNDLVFKMLETKNPDAQVLLQRLFPD
jgi:tetratricopeptide (TPR) repeat protein